MSDLGRGRDRRRDWLRITVAVAVLAAVGLAACGSDDEEVSAGTDGRGIDLDELAATDWVLVPDASTPAIGGEPSTFSWRDGRASGTLQCNAYAGEMAIGADGVVETGALASTMVACFPEELAEAEAAFSTALESVVAATIADDGTLVLTGSRDEVRLVFAKFEADAVLPGAWEVVNVSWGDAIRSVIEGTSPVLTFVDDGTLTLTTGCNDIASAWTLVGHEIAIDPPRQTMMACLEPEGVMEQEAGLGGALERARRVEITRDQLTLLDAEGLILLSAIRADD